MGAAGIHLRQDIVTPAAVERVLHFLWLGLTNRCNLRCVHCYTDSSPYTGDRDKLSAEDYEVVMVQARASAAAGSS